MKVALSSLGTALFWVVGCGAAGGGAPAANTGGAPGGGGKAGGSGGLAGSSSVSGAGGGGTSPVATGGSGAGGVGAGGGGTGGGGAGGGAAVGFVCPPGPYEVPSTGGAVTPARVEGVPPADAFNQQNGTFGNIEGPVWIGDALYVSEIAGGNNPPASRVLKITAGGVVSVANPDSGSNGLAVNNAGELLGAVHKDGSISKLSLAGGAAVPLVSMFAGKRFNSPNDLAIHSNGTLYFTDPQYQAPNPVPQAATRLYRVPSGQQASEVEALNAPNGVTLSKDEDFLYVGGGQLRRYPVMADGSLGTGSTFVNGASTDGMVSDCAGNLYTAQNGVTIYSPAGALIGVITVSGVQQVTNVAFGGADHKTLYITALGSQAQKGLFKAAMNVPGFPY